MIVTNSFSSLRKQVLRLLLVFGAAAAAQGQLPSLSASSSAPSSFDFTPHNSVSGPTGASSSKLVDAPGEAAAATPATPAAPGEVIAVRRTPAAIQPRLRFGGIHEFSVNGGVSRVSGPMWGYRQDVDLALVHLRYSRVMKNGKHFTASFSPEVTPYIRLDEPILDGSDNILGRKHTTGGGVSPVGFTVAFAPTHHVQPFLESNYGVLYFRDRVLSPEGSQFMHTVDMGIGMQIYQSRHLATTVGFRYNHLSNANISQHNPGTDGEVFYLGISRFHSPRNRDGVH
jgi:hypothetical protein